MLIAARGGTIFLDEIGEMPWNCQAKILRAIQEREVEPLGSGKTKKIDVKVIAATNKNLEKAISDEEFREDLYFRLNVIPVRTPTLAERREDIAVLVKGLSERVVNRFNKWNSGGRRKSPGYDDEALALLMNHNWRGNVRELENVVERVIAWRKEADSSRVTADDVSRAFGKEKTSRPAIDRAVQLVVKEIVGARLSFEGVRGLSGKIVREVHQVFGEDPKKTMERLGIGKDMLRRELAPNQRRKEAQKKREKNRGENECGELE